MIQFMLAVLLDPETGSCTVSVQPQTVTEATAIPAGELKAKAKAKATKVKAPEAALKAAKAPEAALEAPKAPNTAPEAAKAPEAGALPPRPRMPAQRRGRA